MAKPVTAVAFRPDAPVEVFAAHFKSEPFHSVIGELRVMNCTTVEETSFGFLHLVPVTDVPDTGLGIYVPPHYIAWMLKAPIEHRPGFV